MPATTPEAPNPPHEVRVHRSLWMDVWLAFRNHTGALAGVVVFSVVVLAVTFGPFIHDVDPQYLDIRLKNQGPSLAHPMGTDNLGRDMFAQVLAGGRISLAVGFTAMLLSLVLGTVVGVLAGYFNRLDGLLMRTTDLFPRAAPAPASPRDHHVVPRRPAHRVRAGDRDLPAHRVRHRHHELDADCAHRARRRAGAEGTRVRDRGAQHRHPPARIITRHVLPNVLSPIMVSATLGIANAIITESALSFLGLGFRPTSRLGPAAVRRGELHDHHPGAGAVAGARDLAHGAERQLHRRRVAGCIGP